MKTSYIFMCVVVLEISLMIPEVIAKTIQQESEFKAQEIRQEADGKADKLKKDVVAQVVSIINKVEEESFELRKKTREQEILKRFCEQQVVQRVPVAPVTNEWRQDVKNEFNTNTLLMKQIIIDGEEASYVPDFLQRFHDQAVWFDNTLRGTQYVNDENYRQIIDKQVRLRNVIEAQKQADTILADLTEKLKLNDYSYKKSRLLSLYELNALLQKGQQKVGFSDQSIKDLVLRVTRGVPGQVVSKDNFKKECSVKLEEKEKNCLDLTLQLTGATQKIDFLDKQLKEAKNYLDRVKLIELCEKEKRKELEKELFNRAK